MALKLLRFLQNQPLQDLGPNLQVTFYPFAVYISKSRELWKQRYD